MSTEQTSFEPRSIELPRLELPRFELDLMPPMVPASRTHVGSVSDIEPLHVPAPIPPAPAPAPASEPIVHFEPVSPAPAVAVAPSPAPASAATFTASYMPAADDNVDAIAAPTRGMSTSIVVLMLLSAGIMLYVATMAGSAALIALAGLFVADIGMGAAVTAGAQRSTGATLAGLAGVLLAVASLWKFTQQFSEMAFVAGLFVVVAVLPVLLLSGICWFIARRTPDSPANQLVRRSGRIRLAALLLTLVAGVVAFTSFSAKPDALVCVPIMVLAAMHAIGALRHHTTAA